MYKIIVLIISFITCIGCTNKSVKEIIYVPVQDTISNKNNIIKIIELEHKLKLTKDSLDLIKDSLGCDLFVANYKLARIKKYNQIAGKGNNIKYLRGWINRVVNE